MDAFDLKTATLTPGIHFIEANAGSGKTFSVEWLVIRALTVNRIPADRIQILSFSESAAKELKVRLVDTLTKLLSDNYSGQRPFELPPDWRDALEESVPNGNLAIDVSTMHAFAFRAIQQYASDATVPLAYMTPSDGADIKDRAMSELCMYGLTGTPEEQMVAQIVDLRMLAELAIKRVLDPDSAIPFSGEAKPPRLKDLGQAFLAALPETKGAAKDALIGLCKKHKRPPDDKFAGMFGGPFRDLEIAVKEGDLNMLAGALSVFQRLEVLEFFNGHNITPYTETPFYKQVAGMLSAIEQEAHRIINRLARQFDAYRRNRANYPGIVLYDELIAFHRQIVEERVNDDDQSIDALFVDEYQDTNTIQWEILKYLIEGGIDYVYFVGDPKQSLYEFRGADMAAYNRSKEAATQTFALSSNWRSAPTFIDALNYLFSDIPKPFVYKAIEYTPSSPQKSIEGSPGPPITIRIRELNKERIKRDVVARVIGYYNELSDEQTIAVVCRKNDEVVGLYSELLSQGLPVSMTRETNIYKTSLCQSVYELLTSLELADDERHLRGLLASDLVAPQHLAAVIDETAGAASATATVLAAQSAWHEQGLSAAIGELEAGLGLGRALFPEPDSARSRQIYEQLTAAISKAENDHQFGPRSLIRWLGERMSGSAATSEHEKMRTGDDNACIQVMTIHQSKGREFDHVVIPSTLSAKLRPKPPYTGLDETDRKFMEVLPKSFLDPAVRDNLERFSLSEETRNLYVAVTRAIRSCTIYACQHFQATHTAIAYLAGGYGEKVSVLKKTLTEFANKSDGRIGIDDSDSAFTLPAISRAVAAPDDAIEPEGTEMISDAEVFPAAKPTVSKLTSYSSLATKDFDDTITFAVSPTGEGGADLFDGLEGTVVGLAVHELIEDVLETSAFKPERAQQAIANHCQRHGIYSEAFATDCQEMLSVLASVSFSADETTFTLGKLKPPAVQCELPFEFNLSDQPAGDIVNGIIDVVVFHEGQVFLIDWKTNNLGSTAADYSKDSLTACMAAQDYHTQAKIYGLAVMKYLASVGLSNTFTFGGVYYAFIRGMMLSRGKQGLVYLPKERIIPDA